MMWKWVRFVLAAGCLMLGLLFMILAVFGVNRFHKALNRMHAAALGDTMGILFVILGLMIMRGFSMDSLKLLLVILFFWMASPVSGHMISRLEVMTDEQLGEITLIHRTREKGNPADGGELQNGRSGSGISGSNTSGSGTSGSNREEIQNEAI